MAIPILGWRFHPSDEEIINHYLRKAINRESTGAMVIPKADVYSCDPCTLDWPDNEMKKVVDSNERYFLVERKQIAAGGKRSRRSLKESDMCDGGLWKLNNGHEICDGRTGRIIGRKNVLTFFRGRRKKGRNHHRKEECEKTDYIMHEYLLAGHGFQELALCRIKFNGNNTTDLPAFGGNYSYKYSQDQDQDQGLLDEEESAFASNLEDLLDQTPLPPLTSDQEDDSDEYAASLEKMLLQQDDAVLDNQTPTHTTQMTQTPTPAFLDAGAVTADPQPLDFDPRLLDELLASLNSDDPYTLLAF